MKSTSLANTRIGTRELTDEEVEERLVSALRGHSQSVTEADLVVRSGLPSHQVGPGLRRLLAEYRSRLSVTADGQLLYTFDPDLVRRDHQPWAAAKATARLLWRAFAVSFKVVTGLVLLVYVAMFAVLLLLFFGQGLRLALSWDSLRKPNRLRRLGSWLVETAVKSSRMARQVFAFMFGTSETPPDEFQDERELLAFIRERRGLVTPAGLIAQTGWTTPVMDQESTRLIARYGGDVEVDEQGHLLFTFENLLTTGGKEDVRPSTCPPPCWQRLEKPLHATGNPNGVDWTVAVVNVFVLASATLIFPLKIAPELRIDPAHPAVFWGLIVIPAIYSVGAFLVHGLRRLTLVAPENRRRLQRNTRRLLLRDAFGQKERHPGRIADELGQEPTAALLATIREMTAALALELDAESSPGANGRTHYQWKKLAESEAAAAARREGSRGKILSASKQPIIYSTESPS